MFVSGALMPIKDGTLKGYVKVAQDMTERRTANEKLRLAEERCRIALQSAEMGAWDWNIAEDKIGWNDQHFIMLGVQPQDIELHADYFLQFVHPDDLEKVKAALTTAVERTGVYQAEFRIIRPDNEETRWMAGFGRVVDRKEDRATRMVGVMFDITERKTIDQQREEFIGIASHELKTPITSIKAYAQMLENTFEDNADSQSVRMMRKLDGQVDRLTDLIRDLLDTTKIAEGQLPLKREELNLSELITEQVEELQRISDKHPIRWQPGSECRVMADKERIGQVLTNLLSNAIKYSPGGGEVTIRCERENDHFKVSVQDGGIGIPEDVQRKVFDRFYRVKNQQMQSFPGMGLGLYITAGIIYRHGGEIWVESKLGEGSTFFFTLPIGEAA
jgi:two-component system, chemotaxis family, CheB/CheR fusion protein